LVNVEHFTHHLLGSLAGFAQFAQGHLLPDQLLCLLGDVRPIFGM
jgi:hypothetical protein